MTSSRRRFLKLFGGGAAAGAVAATPAVARSVTAPLDPLPAATEVVEMYAEEALREAFLRESQHLMEGGPWGGSGSSRMGQIKDGLDVLKELDRLGIRPLRRL